MKCCFFEMLERKNHHGEPIYWCTSCGNMLPRKEKEE